jgi:hypothetical protein
MIRLKPGEPVKIKLKSVGTKIVTPVPFEKYPAAVPLFWKLGIFAVDLDSRKFYGSFLIVRSFYTESRSAKRSSVDGWADPRNGLRVACRAWLR